MMSILPQEKLEAHVYLKSRQIATPMNSDVREVEIGALMNVKCTPA